MTSDIDFHELGRALREDRNVVVLTGAGISAESGIDTFRGKEGLWQKYDPSEVATPGAFKRDPDRVWSFYQMRRRNLEGARPGPGHRILAELDADYPPVRVITQNVDDLHEQAGHSGVLHVHGRIFKDRCSGCGRVFDQHLQTEIPTCSTCGALLRPDVVWFGEPLDSSVLETAYRWAQSADWMLVVGTSLQVYPVSDLPGESARAGAVVIEVNPRPGEHALGSVIDHVFTGTAGSFFESLRNHLN